MSATRTSVSEWVSPGSRSEPREHPWHDDETPLPAHRRPASGHSDHCAASRAADVELADRLTSVAVVLARVRSQCQHLRAVTLDLSDSRTHSVSGSRSRPRAPGRADIGLRLVDGLLRGEIEAARRLGIRLDVDAASRLRRLPPRLDELGVVSIIENLLHNAFDAVGAAAGDRRRVTVLVSDADARLRVRVRDWGCGIGGVSRRSVVLAGFTTKPGHTGLGLSVIDDLVRRAGGHLTVTGQAPGAVFDVVVPYA